MIIKGLKFMLDLGIGSILMLFAAVLVSALIYQLERLAHLRGWIEEPIRFMPRAQVSSTVIPFAQRHSSTRSSRSKV